MNCTFTQLNTLFYGLYINNFPIELWQHTWLRCYVRECMYNKYGKILRVKCRPCNCKQANKNTHREKSKWKISPVTHSWGTECQQSLCSDSNFCKARELARCVILSRDPQTSIDFQRALTCARMHTPFSKLLLSGLQQHFHIYMSSYYRHTGSLSFRHSPGFYTCACVHVDVLKCVPELRQDFPHGPGLPLPPQCWN